MSRLRGLDFVTLELIVNAAEEGSISRAAKRVHLALAAASRRISEFERRAGVQVFERRARGVRPSPAGRAVLNRVHEILADVNALHGTVEDLRSGVTEHLSLLANNSSIMEFLPELLARFIAQHPHARVEVEELLSPEIVHAVAERRGSLGIVTEWGDIDVRGLSTVPVGEDELVLVAPSRHALARRRAVTFDETLVHDFVSLEAGSPSYLWLRREAGRLNVALRSRIQVRGYDALCRMVEAGLGIGVVPLCAAAGFAKSMSIKYIRLREPWARRRFSLIHRGIASLAPVEKSFVAFIEREWKSRHGNPGDIVPASSAVGFR